ncbi:hypothetical protein IGJ26_000989 [Enterococcus sp. AZ095a]|uniref:phage tail tip lysozyme n=1 Tax=Enterococcus sp. AZ095a TaxID=2774718 RepID=UPI003D2FD1C4
MGQKETAKEIWDYFTSKGWTQQAVSGLLGNIQSESGIIADRWESDIVGNMSGGYGLVQWTPATKYINWAKENGLTYQNVISQCKRIEYEVTNNIQWFSNPQRPDLSYISFKDFTELTDVSKAAEYFIAFYEHPLNPNQPARSQQAIYWYNQFKDSIPQTINISTVMECIYWRPSQTTSGQNNAYYFDGTTSKYLDHPDQITIIERIYKDNYGKSIPTYHFDGNTPWYTRIEQISGKPPVSGALG